MNKVKLKDIGNVVTGKTPSTTKVEHYSGNDFMFIVPEDLTENPVSIKISKRYISKTGMASIRSSVVTGASVAVGSIGSDMGNVGFIDDIFTTNQQINTLTKIRAEYEPKFVFYHLKQYKDYFRQIAGGSTTPIMTKRQMEDITIQTPDLSTQKSIARTLSLLDDKITLNRHINTKLEALAQDLYNYWFVQFDFPDANNRPYKTAGGAMVYNEELKRKIPAEWEAAKLENLISIERGISYTSTSIADNTGTPMINLGSIDTSRNYRVGMLKFFSGEHKQEKIVSSGDMLIACTDLTRNADIIGSPILVPDEYTEYVYSMDLAKISTDRNSLCMYLYESLRTDFYHNYIKHFASGTNVLHLDMNGVKWYALPMPPSSLQKQFSDITRPLHEQKAAILNENARLVKLRDFLLPILMNGQAKIKD